MADLQQQILAEVQRLNRRMDVLNTRLFGNPEGEAGDEGRLVIAERRINDHARRLASIERHKPETHEPRISGLERFRWWVLGGLAVAYALFMWSTLKK